MTARAIVVLAAGLLSVVHLPAQENEKTELEKLQGEWAVVSMETAGKTMDEEGIKTSKIVMKGDEWLWTTRGGAEKPKEFAVDATKAPKEINLTATEQTKDVWRGIYKLDGDTLTVCRSLSPGGVRPKEFKAGEGVVLAVYKRAVKF